MIFNQQHRSVNADAAFQPVENALSGVAVHRPPLERDAHCDKHGFYTSLCHIGDGWLGCRRCYADECAVDQARDARQLSDERVRDWERRIGRAGIPSRFTDRTLESYVAERPDQLVALQFARAYADGFTDVRATGRSAIFAGWPGTGKTHLAVGIGLQVMKTHRASVLFAVAGRIVRMVKDTWVKGSAKSESDVIAEMVFPDLLIIDEVGVQQGTEFERHVLFNVLNERYESCKPTLVMANSTLEDLSTKYLGAPSVDRLAENGGAVVSFTWSSHRRKAQS